MQRDKAIEEVKQHLTDYLQEKGLPLDKPFTCLNPDHPDHHPSMSYNRKNNTVHCFSCDKTYDLLSLVQMDNNCDFNKALEIACKKYGIQLDNQSQGQTMQTGGKQYQKQQTTQDYTDLYEKAEKNLDLARGYLQERGISEATARRFHLGIEKLPVYATDQSGQSYATEWTCLVIPTSKESYVIRNLDRKADHENRYQKKGKAHIFNLEAAKQEKEKPIIITEGEIDCMSVIEAGGQAVALGSVTNIRLLTDALRKDWQPVTPLVIALDNDAAGKEAAARIRKELNILEIENYTYNPYGLAKDANEALTTNRAAFANTIKAINADIAQAVTDQERAEYMKTTAAAHLDDFLDGITERAATPPISTGFQNLDAVLDGGLYEGLYFLGAISSLGKTTLALQICDQVAQGGHDTLIFSLEMARSELMAKSISRLTYLEAKQNKKDTRYAKTTRGILDGSRYKKYGSVDKEVFSTALDQYKQYAGHVFINEGIGNIGVSQIRETVRKHIELTGHRPVVVIDYVQIIAPEDPRATDKANMDHNVTELKRISRDYKVPVIGISSFNRESYKIGSNNAGHVSMTDFKESGSLEYSSDILMGLEFKAAGKGYDEKEEKKKDPREIRLVILKNRNGKAWQSCDFDYYPMFNYFEESITEKEEQKEIGVKY